MNWFQVAIAVLQAAGAVYALTQGKPLLASLMATYTVASLILAFL